MKALARSTWPRAESVHLAADGLTSSRSPGERTHFVLTTMTPISTRPGVLFLCVANSARSQIAEGIANRLAPPDVEIYSAGSSPGRISSYAIRVLAEIGIDAAAQYAKPIDSIPLERIGTVITLCAEEVCPTVPAVVQRVHWPIADPTSVAVLEPDVIEAFRRVRDELWSRLSAYFGSAET